MKYRVYYVLLLVLTMVSLQAQDEVTEEKKDKPKYYYRLDASYIFGGQVYNDNFTYNPAIGGQFSIGRLLNKHVALGTGVGLQYFDDERFVPIFLEATGFKKSKSNSGYIKMQVGYSYAFANSSAYMDDYELNGGAFFDAGIGKKFELKNDYHLHFQVSYRHQFAELEYDIFNDKDFTTALNYDMLVLSLGFSKHK